MKIFYTCLILILCANSYAWTQAIEEEAIKAVIQAETDDFTKIPFSDMIRKYWILDENTFMCVTDGNGNAIVLRKDDLLANNDIAPEEKTIVEKTKYTFIINGNMATVYHQQKVTLVEFDYKVYSHEIRILEKVDGLWKIHCSSVQNYLLKK